LTSGNCQSAVQLLPKVFENPNGKKRPFCNTGSRQSA
jgi:hypothetical protein